MSPRRSPPCVGAVARAAAPGHAPEQRRHPIDELRLAYDDLEALMRAMDHSGRSRPSTETLDEQANRIAARIARAFRAPVIERAVNPPLFVDGLSAGW